jgi:ribosomal protein L3 glutamine methyltransferase
LLVLEVGLGAEALCQRVPEIPFLWMDFAEGGDGVLAIRAEELHRYREYLI